VLMEMGVIAPEDLERVLLRQQTDYLGHILEIETGAYRFDATTELPPWTVGVPSLNPYRAILLAMQRPCAGTLVEQSNAAIGSASLVLSADAAKHWDELGWNEEESTAMAALLSPTPLEAVLRDSTLPPEQTRALIATLWLLGLVERVAELPLEPDDAGRAAPEAVAPADAPESESEPEHAAEPQDSAPPDEAVPGPAADPVLPSADSDSSVVSLEVVKPSPPTQGVAMVPPVKTNPDSPEARSGTVGASPEGATPSRRPSRSAPAPRKDVVYEALLAACQGWLSERDPSNLEKRLRTLLDQLKSGAA